MSAPLIKRGQHWSVVGQPVVMLPRRNDENLQGRMSVHCQSDMHMYGGMAHVVEEMSLGPFTLVARMAPEQARDLARNLLKAADRAEEVQALREGREAPCPSSK